MLTLATLANANKPDTKLQYAVDKTDILRALIIARTNTLFRTFLKLLVCQHTKRKLGTFCPV